MSRAQLSGIEKKEGRHLFITIFLNFIISIVEITGGIFSNSLALISDAFHNLSDGLAVLITYIAVKISRKDSNIRKTFGYKRIQILAALFNSVVLIVICVFLLFEAYNRFMQPEPINSVIMFVVALIGLLANIAGVFLLKQHSGRNINIKSAYLHLIGDTLASVAVIVGGVLIYFFKVYWIDPVITALISLYIIKETIGILLETYNILMQGTPKNIDVFAIQNELVKLNEVNGIHHVHVWNLSDKDIHFEAHVDIQNDIKISESETVLKKIEDILQNKFGISHVTLQMEYNFCDDKNIIQNSKFINERRI